ncbi:MAG: S-layer homology domain-containing protein [Oscillospiraceae bacterium]|nr:S-layer homology domain-containing protein [Oscillospiraceae bacterium]
MKKLIALLLALVLLCGAVTAAFTDEKSVNTRYREAVSAMSEKGVIGGFPDGSFKPKDTLTRAQAAKIICTVLEGADKVDAITATASFADVPAEHWAAKFIGYCAEKGIVSGVGNNKFDPNGQLTGFAFGKMLLVAYGHNAETEGLTGAGWDTHVAELLKKEGRDYQLKVSGDPLPRQEACQMAYNFTLPAVDTSAYAETTVEAKTDSALYKTNGRTRLGDEGLELRWPGDSIEFTAELSGDVVMYYKSGENVYLQTFVDGVENLRFLVTASANEKKVKVAENVRPGEHTIRIVRDSDIVKSSAYMTFLSLSFSGVKSTVKATEQKKLLIEYVGDSITSGKYTLPDTGDTEKTHSATHSYAYLVSQELDADWIITSRGGVALIRTKENGGGSCPKTMAQCYDYINPFAADEELIRYDFTRKPDVVVMALGTNDNKSGEELTKAAVDMIKQIKDRNGANVKIVVMYGMMTGSHFTELEAAAKETGSYALKVTRDNSGGNNHPGVAGHQKNAEELVAFLKTIL